MYSLVRSRQHWITMYSMRSLLVSVNPTWNIQRPTLHWNTIRIFKKICVLLIEADNG